jgi:putative transposase
MARRPRHRLSDVPQLVSLQGHNNDPVFVNGEDYATFTSCMGDSAGRNNCDIHAYCLLPNRVVILCTPLGVGNLSTFVQDLSRRYVPFFNAHHGRSGALWNGRFQAAIVEPSGFVVTAYQFVDTLPVRAGLVSKPSAYRRSSYAAHTGIAANPVLTDHPMFSMVMGNGTAGRQEYANSCEAGLSAERVEDIEHTVHHGLVLGCESYKERLALNHDIKVRLGQPGRPTKHGATSASIATLQACA